MIKVGHAINPVLRLILQDRDPLPACSKSLSSHNCFLGCKALIVAAVILTYCRRALTAMLETLTDTPAVPTKRPAQYHGMRTKFPQIQLA